MNQDMLEQLRRLGYPINLDQVVELTEKGDLESLLQLYQMPDLPTVIARDPGIVHSLRMQLQKVVPDGCSVRSLIAARRIVIGFGRDIACIHLLLETRTIQPSYNFEETLSVLEKSISDPDVSFKNKSLYEQDRKRVQEILVVLPKLVEALQPYGFLLNKVE